MPMLKAIDPTRAGMFVDVAQSLKLGIAIGGFNGSLSIPVRRRRALGPDVGDSWRDDVIVAEEPASRTYPLDVRRDAVTSHTVVVIGGISPRPSS